MSYVIDFDQEEVRDPNYVLRLRGTPDGVVDLSKNNSLAVNNIDCSIASTLGTGRRMKFNGVDSYIHLKHITNLCSIKQGEDFTVSYWVFQEGFTSSQTNSALSYTYEPKQWNEMFPSFSLTTDSRINHFEGGYWYKNGNQYIPEFTDNNVPFFTNVTNFTKPYHVGVVRYNGTTKLALNGSFSSVTLTCQTDLYKKDTTFFVGYSPGSGATVKYANFTIDDLCIIKGRALWTSNFTPPSSYLPDL